MIQLGERIKQSGALIALSAASLSLFVSVIMFKIEIDAKASMLFLLVFSTTLTVYGLDRWLELRSAVCKKVRGSLKRVGSLSTNTGRWQAGIILFYAISLSISFLFANISVSVLVMISPLIVLIYSKDSPLMKGRNMLPVKRVPLLKSIYIALGWTFLAPFSMIYYQRWPTIGDIFFMGVLFVKLFIMTIVYDFKDIEIDRRELTWTLPLKLGGEYTKLSLQFLNLIASAACFVLIISGPYHFYAIVLVLMAPYQAIMISRCRPDASEWLYFGVCDLEQSIWLLGLLSMLWMVQLGII